MTCSPLTSQSGRTTLLIALDSKEKCREGRIPPLIVVRKREREEAIS